MLIYTALLASSQIFLRLGASQIGGFSLKAFKDLLPLILTILKNPSVLIGTSLMASSFFLWIYILSWFKLALAFPLTAIAYIFVAVLSYFLLGERLLFYNYLGIGLIACGIFFLLYK